MLSLQAVNSASFVQLNDYLTAINTGKSLRGQPIHLTFYTHTTSNAAEEATITPATHDVPSTSTPPSPPTRPPSSPPSPPSPASPLSNAAPNSESPPLQRVALIFPTDFFHVSSFRSSSSPSRLSSLALKQIHDNLTSLFTSLAILTPLTLPPDLATPSPSSSPDDDEDEDEPLHAGPSDISLPSFLSSVRDVALHTLQSQQVQRSGRILRSAQMRLQGVKSVFQWFSEADEVPPEVQEATLLRWEQVLRKIPTLSAGLTLEGEGEAERDMREEEQRVQRERHAAEQRMGVHAEGGDQRQATPMSRSAGAPFSRLLSQIRRAHGDATGEVDGAVEAEEPRRPSNPLLQTTTVFCSSSQSSHVDNRGRLVLALRETDSQWFSFLTLPSLFTVSQQRISAYSQCKVLEQQTAALLGLRDVFADLSMTSTPPYVAYILQLQQSSHSFHSFFTRHPHLLKHLVLRIDATSPALAVDPLLGLVLVPLHTPIPSLLSFLGSDGERAVQVAQAYTRDQARYDEAVMAVKRRYKVRRLDRERGVSEGEMLQCCDRLLRAGGVGSGMRGWLEGMEVEVGREYRFVHQQGKIVIPWNFQMTSAEEGQQYRQY